MQLLDVDALQTPSQNLPQAAASERLQAELHDIVHNLQIQSNLCIHHPDYQPLELDADAIERFGNLSPELQHKYLSLQLRGFLYGIYYNGSLKAALAPDADSESQVRSQDFENNTFLGVDLAFYNRLHETNRGEGYFAPGWQVLRQEEDGSFAVTRGGLTLHIERDQHLQSPDQSITVGDVVAIRMPRNLVQNGFYMAVGNAGSQHQEIVRVYFNLSAEGAISVMDSLTRQLNHSTLPFSFKALYNPSEYDRHDSAVLYFAKSNYPIVRSVLQTVYSQHQKEFRESIPLFTKWIAPGLAIAEEPDQKFAEQESFGMNRCQIVTNGLLEAWQQGQDTPEQRLAAIARHFALMGIEMQRPYLNANSEDIYTALDL